MSDPAVPADSTRTCVESYGSGRYHTKPVLCVNVSILYIIISENSWNKNKDKKKVWTKKHSIDPIKCLHSLFSRVIIRP